MNHQPLPPIGHSPNLSDYDKVYSSFHWEDVEPEFDWRHTGRVNLAHEAIDRHALNYLEQRSKIPELLQGFLVYFRGHGLPG